eukprot:TRINITY_DN7855_c0_g1_i1.p1 TRINITY_DN7855_c0_g1~~TRINITY_DN7855_c0_g1_i1.p1  ORF type:complete len:472 (-),score=55.80 TRINITY_DN7855_c0_g1_i1:30-1415(-)
MSARVKHNHHHCLEEQHAIRQQILEDYKVLSTGPEEALQTITRLAAHICDCPISFVTLVDFDKWTVFMKSSVGLDVRQVPIGNQDEAFCVQCILGGGFLNVTDAGTDPRFKNCPLVTGGPLIKFYCGVGLVLDEKVPVPVGTLCVLDYKPRTLQQKQIDMLKALSMSVVRHLQLRRTAAYCINQLASLQNLEHELSESVAQPPQVASPSELVQLYRKDHAEFASTVGHEVRTPSNAIQIAGALLHSTQLTPVQNEYLTLILAASNQLQTILDGLLQVDLSPASDIEYHHIDARSFLRALVHLYRIDPTVFPGCHFKEPQVYADVPSTIQSDPVRLSQVLVAIIGHTMSHNPMDRLMSLFVRVSSSPSSSSASSSCTVTSAPSVTPPQSHVALEIEVRASPIHPRRLSGEMMLLDIAPSDFDTFSSFGLARVAPVVASLGGTLSSFASLVRDEAYTILYIQF